MGSMFSRPKAVNRGPKIVAISAPLTTAQIACFTVNIRSVRAELRLPSTGAGRVSKAREMLPVPKNASEAQSRKIFTFSEGACSASVSKRSPPRRHASSFSALLTSAQSHHPLLAPTTGRLAIKEFASANRESTFSIGAMFTLTIFQDLACSSSDGGARRQIWV